jgi:hypothetical protein
VPALTARSRAPRAQTSSGIAALPRSRAGSAATGSDVEIAPLPAAPAPARAPKPALPPAIPSSGQPASSPVSTRDAALAQPGVIVADLPPAQHPRPMPGPAGALLTAVRDRYFVPASYTLPPPLLLDPAASAAIPTTAAAPPALAAAPAPHATPVPAMPSPSTSSVQPPTASDVATIEFASGSAAIETPELLEALVTRLPSATRYVVRGRAIDTDANPSRTLRLAQARALIVRRTLKELGVDSEFITIADPRLGTHPGGDKVEIGVEPPRG